MSDLVWCCLVHQLQLPPAKSSVKVLLLHQLLVYLLSSHCPSTAGAMGPQGGMPGMNQMGAQGGGQVRFIHDLLVPMLLYALHSTVQQLL